jgi:RHS repeat-associated protein
VPLRGQRYAAEIALRYAYSAYGETVALGPDGGNPLQYTGRENDGTGLYYYRARYYDPLLKRFIAEDPIGLDGGDANLYAYVGGDPTGLVDPEGLSSLLGCANPANAAVCAAAGIGGTVGGATSLVANVASQLSQNGCVSWNQAAIATGTGILTGVAMGAVSTAPAVISVAATPVSQSVAPFIAAAAVFAAGAQGPAKGIKILGNLLTNRQVVKQIKQDSKLQKPGIGPAKK